MEIAEHQQHIAKNLGVGIYFYENSFYELYTKRDTWHVNVLWGKDNQEVFVLTDALAKEGIKLDQRHFDAIERVDAPVQTVAAELPKVEQEAEIPCDKLSAVEVIVESLIAAREVADEEINMGFVTDSISGDMFKVSVQYIGNQGK